MPDVDPAVVQAFAGVGLFADLKKRQVTTLANAARKVVHSPGDEVAAEGRAALAFHVITDGEASVRVGTKVRRTLRPGDYFGEISMIDGLPRSATVLAGGAGLTTYALNRTQFLSILDKDRAIARAVMVALCGRIRAGESSV
jgi:CRP-like cAMP-binding protein